ncbi:MAG: hypothetical protein IT204_15560 [Fimbriimonadaceae bacterium]|nr:hypothetical protein [Fimbriimonadaceae bacterium]
MPDDRREEEEFKITVRDRRRVNLEGELREVEDAPAPPPPPPPPPPEPPQAAEKPRPRTTTRAAGGGALGGADQARRSQQAQRLREVVADDGEDAADDDAEGAAGGQRAPQNIYEYCQALTTEMMVWAIANLGLMAHPTTRLVTTDMAQAEFAIEAAQSLIDTLISEDKVDGQTVLAIYQSFIVQFGSVAAQLLQQPPQTRLAEIRKVRFCIDVAERFFERFRAEVAESEEAELQGAASELHAFVSQLRLAFVQASGGGGIVG